MTDVADLVRDIVTTGDSAAPYSVQASEGFAGWLHQHGLALAVSTYQIGKLFLIGAPSTASLSVTERTFERALGIAVSGSSLYLAGLNAIWRFENVIPPGGELEGHDAVYVPQTAWFTGDVFAHDVGILPSGRPLFVNTMFSCLATVDDASSFRNVWQPPFISRAAPGDRCHLNGLAMDPASSMPAYMTAAGAGDEPRAWAAGRVGGGVVLDIAANAVVCRGLTMPHSPRLHGGKLYLLNAGTGELGIVEPATGRFEAVGFVPGFARGLALHAGFALIGISLPRSNQDFSGLPLEGRLRGENTAPDCAVIVMDLATGAILHTLRLGGVVRELYDIALLPGPTRPMLVGMAQNQINRLITVGAPIPVSDLRAL
jgi:uncharacterized protein (TIGR03032 family)